ncbi:unnamed protein product [Vitrella brassicaformis CCMP3155]|uniref:Uncharacterized protein n=1 Tax=Vitrella brassicaformis (strain CCMP3155) TaxID=1169540 RepID=A0A0G4FJ10_VITBC|nr:unnamed protein product [Vitrella brassicaformis CCMP3155]|eukprot:CEM13704.1 unnamed protein product [Vitrella brassicaformis CCMP3155]
MAKRTRLLVDLNQSSEEAALASNLAKRLRLEQYTDVSSAVPPSAHMQQDEEAMRTNGDEATDDAPTPLYRTDGVDRTSSLFSQRSEEGSGDAAMTDAAEDDRRQSRAIIPHSSSRSMESLIAEVENEESLKECLMSRPGPSSMRPRAPLPGPLHEQLHRAFQAALKKGSGEGYEMLQIIPYTPPEEVLAGRATNGNNGNKRDADMETELPSDAFNWGDMPMRSNSSEERQQQPIRRRVSRDRLLPPQPTLPPLPVDPLPAAILSPPSIAIPLPPAPVAAPSSPPLPPMSPGALAGSFVFPSVPPVIIAPPQAPQRQQQGPSCGPGGEGFAGPAFGQVTVAAPRSLYGDREEMRRSASGEVARGMSVDDME